MRLIILIALITSLSACANQEELKKSPCACNGHLEELKNEAHYG
jgi:uncharacterized lipoprotein YehR (DUF1307 family)